MSMKMLGLVRHDRHKAYCNHCEGAVVNAELYPIPRRDIEQAQTILLALLEVQFELLAVTKAVKIGFVALTGVQFPVFQANVSAVQFSVP